MRLRSGIKPKRAEAVEKEVQAALAEEAVRLLGRKLCTLSSNLAILPHEEYRGCTNKSPHFGELPNLRNISRIEAM